MQNKEITIQGMGMGQTLFVVFLILKLTGVIGWSWWWVTAPLWLPFAIGLVIFLFAYLIFILCDLLDNRRIIRYRNGKKFKRGL